MKVNIKANIGKESDPAKTTAHYVRARWEKNKVTLTGTASCQGKVWNIRDVYYFGKFIEKTKEEIAQEAVFLPPDENDAADDEEGEDDDDDILDTVEKFGKGAAKVRIRILIARNAQKLSNYALYISIMESHVPYLTHKLFLFS